MKKIAIEVLERAPEDDGKIRATFILPDNLTLPERVGIAEAVLAKLEKDDSQQSQT